MKRYNIFYQIHKGLRAMLYDSAQLLQTTDFANDDQAQAAITRVREVIVLFEKHAYSEDNFILAAIETYDGSVASLFIEEHIRDHELGNNLITLVRMFGNLDDGAAKQELGSALRLAFTEFLVFNLEHMAKEEKELNQKLWKYFSDEQLHAITGQIIAAVPQDLMQIYNTWMMRGLSNDEIVQWLLQVKLGAPEFIFNGLLQLAERELHRERFEAVAEALTEGAMIA